MIGHRYWPDLMEPKVLGVVKYDTVGTSLYKGTS